MKSRSVLLGIVLTMFCASTTLAQLTLNSTSANVGTIRTLFPNDSRYTDYQYAFYPELQINGDFLTSFLRWTLYWGYWSDGVENALPVADMVTYSYSSHIIGTRFTFLPANFLNHWPLPIGIFVGTAHHFIAARYVGGFGFDGKPGQDFTHNANTLEVGLNGEVHIFGPLNVRGEVQQFIPLGNSEFDRLQKGRRAYKVGLAISF